MTFERAHTTDSTGRSPGPGQGMGRAPRTVSGGRSTPPSAGAPAPASFLSETAALDAALRLLGAGCSVIPVAHQGWSAKRPHREALLATGHFDWEWSKARERHEQIPRWAPFQEAHATDAMVREWVSAGCRAWGLVTGAISNLVAIDFDEDGKSLLTQLGWTPHTVTPSGGAHVFVRHPGWRVRTAKSGKVKPGATPARDALPQGVDMRGDGGYVVAAPSVIQTGAYRRTDARKFLNRFEIPEVVHHLGRDVNFRASLTLDQDPEILRVQLEMEDAERRRMNLERVMHSGGQVTTGEGFFDGRDAALDAILFRAVELGQTGRNDGAFFLGCQMRDNGYTVDEVLGVYGYFSDQLPATDTKGRRSAFTSGEFEAAVRSAFRGKKRKPWSFDATKRGRK